MSKHGTPFRAMIAGIAAMGPVTLRGQEYAGEYLSTLVAINPESPADESARTSRLISELGRLTAAAHKDFQMAEVDYRQWRAATVTRLTTDTEFCEDHGLLKPGSKKPLSATAAKEAVKQIPEYRDHYEAVTTAGEVYETMHASYEAAKARQWAIKAFEDAGGADHSSVSNNYDDEENDSSVVYHGGHGEDPRKVNEEQVKKQRRTPLPAKSGPPGPPPSNPKRAKPAPPPPPRSES